MFFSIIRPLNEYFLKKYIVPHSNNAFYNYDGINFEFSKDNLVLTLNESKNYYFRMPFSEYYIMLVISFLPKIFSRKYLHYHILNITPF